MNSIDHVMFFPQLHQTGLYGAKPGCPGTESQITLALKAQGHKSTLAPIPNYLGSQKSPSASSQAQGATKNTGPSDQTRIPGLAFHPPRGCGHPQLSHAEPRKHSLVSILTKVKPMHSALHREIHTKLQMCTYIHNLFNTYI